MTLRDLEELYRYRCLVEEVSRKTRELVEKCPTWISKMLAEKAAVNLDIETGWSINVFRKIDRALWEKITEVEAEIGKVTRED